LGLYYFYTYTQGRVDVRLSLKEEGAQQRQRGSRAGKERKGKEEGERERLNEPWTLEVAEGGDVLFEMKGLFASYQDARDGRDWVAARHRTRGERRESGRKGWDGIEIQDLGGWEVVYKVERRLGRVGYWG
jgi:hypothetical protein